MIVSGRVMALGVVVVVVTVGVAMLHRPEGKAQAADTGKKRDITPACEKAIDKGIKWILRAQRPGGGVGMDMNTPPDLGCTAMCGLALMSHGSTPSNGPHRKEIDRMLEFVIAAVDQLPENSVPSTSTSNLQGKIGQLAHHFFAAVFLAQAMGDSYENEDVKEALAKLVRIISQSQQRDGTWGNQSWAPTLGTVMGWVSLRASYSAGMKVGASADKTADALVKKLKENPKYNGWMHQLYKNVSGIRVMYAMRREKDPQFKKAFESALSIVKKDDRAFYQAGGEEYLAFHLITECMLQKRGKAWETWYPTVRDKLIRVQNADGSWTGHHCITSRTFCTAAALLTLQAPNRYLPISDI